MRPKTVDEIVSDAMRRVSLALTPKQRHKNGKKAWRTRRKNIAERMSREAHKYLDAKGYRLYRQKCNREHRLWEKQQAKLKAEAALSQSLRA